MDNYVPRQAGADDNYAYHQGSDTQVAQPMVNWDRQSNEAYRSASGGSRQIGNIIINGDVFINGAPARHSEAFRHLAQMSPEMRADMEPWTVPSRDNIQPRQVSRVGDYRPVYQNVADYHGTDVQVIGPNSGVRINDQRATSGVIYGPDGRVYNGYPPQRDAADDALRAAQVIGSFLGIAGVAKDIFDDDRSRGRRYNNGGWYPGNDCFDRNRCNQFQNNQWQYQRQQQNWFYQQQMNQRRMQSNCGYNTRCR